ncbi:DUF4180 domain-containing protein [Flavobacterium pectinovorum]|jgi:hypothetical protein|uniref:Alpha/beta hydrolase n=1 Tax=Flavobacterium pectinovorum TaxID=29533 RepID=A0AB36NWV6_9FLAO|nr:DUF4180 domain-containing protein [Flavobacterium pectinovorum]OXB00664.1 alpha/beta hydrolase [Flavobacterium pectinovorum]SHM42067.1 protein of unknown function [Flavobacterium pectinovorum]
MIIETHTINNTKIAEVIAENIIIKSIEDGSQLVADIYYQDFDGIILYEKNITPLFFDLKTGIAGEILQKFSNFRIRLAIIGEFEKYESKSVKDFIFESNKNRQINFVNTLEEGLQRFSN